MWYMGGEKKEEGEYTNGNRGREREEKNGNGK